MKGRWYVWAVLLVAVCIAVAVYAVPTWRIFVMRIPVVLDAQGTRYLTGTFTDRMLMEVGLSGEKTVPLSLSGKLVDYARGGGVEAAIETGQDGTEDVYELAPQSRRLTTDGLPKSSLAVSADGTTLAFAKRVNATSTDVASFYGFPAWYVSTFTFKDGLTRVRGAGYGSQFFMQSGKLILMFTNVYGIKTVDLSDGSSKFLPLTLPPPLSVNYDGRASPIISPDGAYLALYNTGESRYELYKTAAAKDPNIPFTIQPVEPFAAGTYLVAFSNDSAYTAVSSSDVNALSMYSLNKPSGGVIVSTLVGVPILHLLAP